MGFSPSKKTDDGKSNVALLVADNEAWLTQNQLAELFDTKNILQDKELDENSVIKDYLITAQDGKNYQVKHYSLAMILAVGFRVRSPRGVQFRRWANTTLQTYLEKGFLIDSERLRTHKGDLIILMNCLSKFVKFVLAKCGSTKSTRVF